MTFESILNTFVYCVYLVWMILTSFWILFSAKKDKLADKTMMSSPPSHFFSLLHSHCSSSLSIIWTGRNAILLKLTLSILEYLVEFWSFIFFTFAAELVWGWTDFNNDNIVIYRVFSTQYFKCTLKDVWQKIAEWVRVQLI